MGNINTLDWFISATWPQLTSQSHKTGVQKIFSLRVCAGLCAQRMKKAEAAGVKDMQDHLRDVQSDAPACNVCGHITVRSGTCYKCLNCGNSLGCS